MNYHLVFVQIMYKIKNQSVSLIRLFCLCVYFKAEHSNSSAVNCLVELDCSSLASHTLRTERKGLVTLQPSSCRHDRNLSGPIRSALFIDHIHCHGAQLRHNVFSGCQHLITEPQWSIIAFLGDNSVTAA